MSFTPLHFHGNVSGLFYSKTEDGAETVPIAFADTTVSVDNGIASPAGQTITEPEHWKSWQPNSGPLAIAFPNSLPVRFLWVTTARLGEDPPVVGVWASAKHRDLWAQGQQTAPTPPAQTGFLLIQNGFNVGIDNTGNSIFFDIDNGAQVTLDGNGDILADDTASIQVLDTSILTMVGQFLHGNPELLANSNNAILFHNGAKVYVYGTTGGIFLNNDDTSLEVDGGILSDGDLTDSTTDSGPEFDLEHVALVVRGSLLLSGRLTCDFVVNDPPNQDITIDAGVTFQFNDAGSNFGNLLTLAGPFHFTADFIVDPSISGAPGCTIHSAGHVLAKWKWVDQGSHTVQFTNGAIADGSDGSITTYAWTFGDSGTSSAASPSHVYASAGTYTVRLTVTTSGGSTSYCEFPVVVA